MIIIFGDYKANADGGWSLGNTSSRCDTQRRSPQSFLLYRESPGVSSANILRMLGYRPLHFIQHAIIILAPYCPTAGMHAKRPSSDAARVRRPRAIADKNYQPADYEITDPICCPLDWSSIMPSDSVTMYAFRPGQMDIFRSRTLSYEANYT